MQKSNAKNHIGVYKGKHIFNLMFYITPKNITVGDIYSKSVILTVVQKTIKAGATGGGNKKQSPGRARLYIKKRPRLRSCL